MEKYFSMVDKADPGISKLHPSAYHKVVYLFFVEAYLMQ
jgi:hypothetical protein